MPETKNSTVMSDAQNFIGDVYDKTTDLSISGIVATALRFGIGVVLYLLGKKVYKATKGAEKQIEVPAPIFNKK